MIALITLGMVHWEPIDLFVLRKHRHLIALGLSFSFSFFRGRFSSWFWSLPFTFALALRCAWLILILWFMFWFRFWFQPLECLDVFWVCLDPGVEPELRLYWDYVEVALICYSTHLVFASLIIPALATRDAKRFRLLKAYSVGAIGYASGLIVSVMTDLPTGAVIVWCMALAGIVFSTLEKSRAPISANWLI